MEAQYMSTSARTPNEACVPARRHATLIRLLLLVGIVAAMVAACSTDDASLNGSDKPGIEPDSVRGDTTFYSYRPRDWEYQRSGTFIFATWGGYWHVGVIEPRGPEGNPVILWHLVSGGLSLYVVRDEAPQLMAAEAVVESLVVAAGDSVIGRRTYPDQDPPWTVYWVTICDARCSASLPHEMSSMLADLPYMSKILYYHDVPDIVTSAWPAISPTLD
jgi:hypothetical protein